MGQMDNLSNGDLARIKKRLRLLETQSALNSASIGRGGLNIYDGGILAALASDGVEAVYLLPESATSTGGTRPALKFETGSSHARQPHIQAIGALSNGTTPLGTLVLMGAEEVLNSTGRTDLWMYPGGDFQLTQTGGDNNATGFYKEGATSRMTGAGGHFQVIASGTEASLNRAESDGLGRRIVVGTANAFMQYGSQALILDVNGTSVNGDFQVSGAKNFIMPHPTKACHVLRHGSTESPVSGVEYWGESTFDSNGESVVELPDYFEPLAKPANRTVTVTPIGKPYLVGADRITDGTFTVYGEPDREFTWLVKAERNGADFVSEAATPEPLKE